MKPCSALRSGDYKLLHWHEDHRLELYDLSVDLGEKRNLATSQPEMTLDLYRKLESWRRQVGAHMPRPNPSFETR
jgi:arylsulfatase A